MLQDLLLVIHSQIHSLVSKGFGMPLIAQAIVVTNISLKTLLKENRSLTAAELNLVLSSCKDLTEASGSSSSSQQILSEEKPQTPQESPRLPLKKRPLKHLEQFEVVEVPAEAPPPKKKHSEEESLAKSLQFLLTTIRENRYQKVPYPVYCPEASREQAAMHRCEICSLTKNIIEEQNHYLIFQMEQLTEHAHLQDVVKAAVELINSGKITSLQKGSRLSYLEAAHLVVKCRLENKLFLADRPISQKLLAIYQATKDVASMGINHPLTKFVIQLWNSPEKLTPAQTILAADDKGNASLLSIPLFLPTFSALHQRRFFAGGSSSARPLSIYLSLFLSELTMATLHAIISSPQNELYVTTTRFGKKAILWRTVNHVLGLILASSSDWHLETPSSKLNFGVPEDLRFPSEDLNIVSQSQQSFIRTNQILQTRMAQSLPSVENLPVESLLLNSSSIHGTTLATQAAPATLEEAPPATPPASSTPLKHQQKTHHVELTTAGMGHAPSEESGPASSSPTQEELLQRQSVAFLLKMIVLNKQRKIDPIIPCPNDSSGGSLHHICPLCFLTKILFCKRRLRIVNQIEILLQHTTETALVDTMMNLPLGRTILTLSEQELLLPLDLVYIVAKCKIGEAMQLPGKRNPTDLIDLYYSTEKLILEGPSNPTTTLISNLWEQTTPEVVQSIRKKNTFPVRIFKDGALQSLSLRQLSDLFSGLEIQFFQRYKEKMIRKQKGSMGKPYVKFFSTLASSTLHALIDLEEAKSYLVDSPEGPAVPWELAQHVCGLMLSINPTWKLSITLCKASLGDSQELSLQEEVATPLFQNLLKFSEKHSMSYPYTG